MEVTLKEIADLLVAHAELLGAKNTSAAKSGFNSFAIGQEVIIRTYSAGVWFGRLKEKSGNEVILTEARRAVELLSDWALNELGLSRLLLRIERENVASIAAALAAGAQPTGITVDEEVRDRARNYGIYELLSSAT